MRTLVVWCPDWPVAAAGFGVDAPAAVVHSNRVVACSRAARAHGVRRGLRKREAQARCPSLAVVAQDPARDARAFEPVVRVVEGFCPSVEIVRPGVCALAARGPARYFGGEDALARMIAGAVGYGSRVGIADGTFAATLAARDGVIVDTGRTPAFLAPYPVAALDRPELADLLVRLGLRTLGDFAALDPSDVLGRLGDDGAEAHRLARGLEIRPLATRVPSVELAVQAEIDPPAERVDHAAFVAKSLADELHEHLHREALACTRIRIDASTNGESLVRLWRHDGGLSASQVADRVRWQLDGWLATGETTAGISLLRLTPDEVKPNTGRQRGFWGSETEADDRAARAFARVQGMLGRQDAVCTAVLSGGREFCDQIALVPWGDPRQPARPGAPGTSKVKVSGWHRAELPQWPGRIPGPAPATVHPSPPPASVLDASGRPATVNGRGLVTAPPARVNGRAVVAWAGPWPLEERWWDAVTRRRRARFQVLLDNGGAHLLMLDEGRWHVEATYD
jgi:protein ImuB